MSVYIQGMEMPNVGVEWVCFVKITNGAVEFYDPTGETESVIYEAVAVPDHGRLIDADKLYKRIATEKNRIAKNYGKNDEYVMCLEVYALRMLVNAQTIIPADKEKEVQE